MVHFGQKNNLFDGYLVDEYLVDSNKFLPITNKYIFNSKRIFIFISYPHICGLTVEQIIYLGVLPALKMEPNGKTGPGSSGEKC